MLIEEPQTTGKQAATGAPDWVTPNLLASTVRTWQPYYAKRLTDADSLEILLGVARLFDALNN